MNKCLYNIVCDDWEVLYDTKGKKIAEGHEIRGKTWFKIGQANPNVQLKSLYLEEEIQEEYDLWIFPKDIEELPMEIQKMLIEESEVI